MWRFCIKRMLREGEEEQQQHGRDGSFSSEEGRAKVQQADVIKCMYICIYKPTSFV